MKVRPRQLGGSVGSAHFAEVYGASIAKSVAWAITERVVVEMHEWSSRPLASHYVAVLVDAIHVKVRDGQVANRPFYAAIGVNHQNVKRS